MSSGDGFVRRWGMFCSRLGRSRRIDAGRTIRKIRIIRPSWSFCKFAGKSGGFGWSWPSTKSLRLGGCRAQSLRAKAGVGWTRENPAEGTCFGRDFARKRIPGACQASAGLRKMHSIAIAALQARRCSASAVRQFRVAAEVPVGVAELGFDHGHALEEVADIEFIGHAHAAVDLDGVLAD